MAAVGALIYFGTAFWTTTGYVPDPNFTVGPNVRGEKILLLRPFARQLAPSSLAYAKERYEMFDDLADTENDPYRSPIELYENEKRLGPPHTAPDEIAALGGGRFSHKHKNGTTLYFSASDNSDPNANGRAYWVVKPSNFTKPY